MNIKPFVCWSKNINIKVSKKMYDKKNFFENLDNFRKISEIQYFLKSLKNVFWDLTHMLLLWNLCS